MILDEFWAVVIIDDNGERLWTDPRSKPRMYQTPKQAAVQARNTLPRNMKFRTQKYRAVLDD